MLYKVETRAKDVEYGRCERYDSFTDYVEATGIEIAISKVKRNFKKLGHFEKVQIVEISKISTEILK